MEETENIIEATPFRLKYKIFKYFEVAKINYNNSAAYLTNIFSRGLIVLLRIWIFAALYTATYAASGKHEINGLTVAMVIWSLMLVQSFQSATKPTVSKLIDEEVKSGALAYSLNRPYSYMLFHYFGFLGRMLPSLLTNLALGTIASLFLIGPIKIAVSGILLGSLLLFFGYILDFIIYLTIGLLAFWIEDTSAFTWIYQKSQFIFGGVILPLSLFPETIRKIAEALPFSQIYYSSARLVVNFDYGLFQRFILVQLSWIVFFAALAGYLFHKGIKHVSINGG